MDVVENTHVRDQGRNMGVLLREGYRNCISNQRERETLENLKAKIEAILACQ